MSKPKTELHCGMCKVKVGNGKDAWEKHKQTPQHQKFLDLYPLIIAREMAKQKADVLVKMAGIHDKPKYLFDEDAIRKGWRLHDATVNWGMDKTLSELMGHTALDLFNDGIAWLKSLNLTEDIEGSDDAFTFLGKENLNRRKIVDEMEDWAVIDRLRAVIHKLLADKEYKRLEKESK